MVGDLSPEQLDTYLQQLVDHFPGSTLETTVNGWSEGH